MSRLDYKNGIIITRKPVIRAGLKEIMITYCPDCNFSYYQHPVEVSSLQLCHADLVIADLTGEADEFRASCEHFNMLIPVYSKIHWIVITSHACYMQAIELMAYPSVVVLTDEAPAENLISAIYSGAFHSESPLQALIIPEGKDAEAPPVFLTHSEREVLKLLGKGFRINQIATFLNKSNKTISAQKNSAMRRLSLHSEADMYKWINSYQGMRVLNQYSTSHDNFRGDIIK